jgi:hypothetical protein
MGHPEDLFPEPLDVFFLFFKKGFWDEEWKVDFLMAGSVHFVADELVDVVHDLPAVRSPDVHPFNGVALVAKVCKLDDLVVPFVKILTFLYFCLRHVLPLFQPKRSTLFLKILVCSYCPLPSFAFTRSSVDLHRLHRSALIALEAPHFMQIFLSNNLASASGNRVIGIAFGVSEIRIGYLNMMPLRLSKFMVFSQ